MQSLHSIFYKNKSDKIPDFCEHNHTYHKKYEKLFKKFRNLPISIFEMGIGTIDNNFKSSMYNYNQLYGYESGSSLKSWAEYFHHPDSVIHGGDIDKSIIHNNYGDKIFTHYIDQCNEQSLKEAFKNLEFDIIIDDGLHTIEAAQTMLNVAWNHLKEDGYYIIEDIVADKNTLDSFNFPVKNNKIEIWFDKKSNGLIENNYLIILHKKTKSGKKFRRMNIKNNKTKKINNNFLSIPKSNAFNVGKSVFK